MMAKASAANTYWPIRTLWNCTRHNCVRIKLHLYFAEDVPKRTSRRRRVMPLLEYSSTAISPPQHPRFDRRFALQAGAIGLVGLGINHLDALRACSAADSARFPVSAGKARSAIYIFLSGGLAQHDSFDMKPDARAQIPGEFKPL